MKKIILIFILFTSLINAQFLELLQDLEKPEINTNVSLDFSYTNIVNNGTFTSWNSDNPTGWAVSSETGTTFVTESSSRARLVSDGAYITLTQTILAINKVYFGVVDIISITGSMIYGDGGTTDLLVSTSGTKTKIWVADNTSHMFKRNASCDVIFDNDIIYELKAPDGFTSIITTATDYVIEDNGCKFVEGTGETKITMSDILKAGYYKLKVTQDWTQGKLWAYNGTTTYNFPQSDGEYIVKIYLPGNKPLVIGCDNNTISVLSSLSIK